MSQLKKIFRECLLWGDFLNFFCTIGVVAAKEIFCEFVRLFCSALSSGIVLPNNRPTDIRLCNWHTTSATDCKVPSQVLCSHLIPVHQHAHEQLKESTREDANTDQQYKEQLLHILRCFPLKQNVENNLRHCVLLGNNNNKMLYRYASVGSVWDSELNWVWIIERKTERKK